MSVVVVATIVPVPEHRAEVIATFKQTIATVHAQDDGCELYALHEGKDRLVMIEKWTTAEALATHGQGPALQQLTVALAGKLAGAPDVQVLRPHPAGNSELGTL
jgi:quinol monooxygenase YgiN